MGTLFVIATPIGNIADITFRAIKTLFEVDVLACEDTRRTGLFLQKLLDEFSSNPGDKRKPRLISYYDQTEVERIPEIITLLKSDQNVGLVSDAGTPLISDPGFKLVRECLKEGIKVESLPGASSVLTALTSAGLPTDRFMYFGYPPHKPGHRAQFFADIKTVSDTLHSTMIIFEAPHKVVKTLTDMQATFGDIEITFCRELTKMYEDIKQKKISEALEQFKKTPPKGEFVLLWHI